ncbi:unnamed protein product [Rhizophagus irregularis]|nr:unnamed protein product [Rhizophagus irregularis]
MSIRNLIIKTAFLLALVTASRPSDLKKVNITTIKSSSSGYTLECRDPKEHKSAKSHSLTKKLYAGRYEEDSLICPYNALQCLLNRTQTWRDDPKNKHVLFLISKLSHTPRLQIPSLIGLNQRQRLPLLPIKSSNSSVEEFPR